MVAWHKSLCELSSRTREERLSYCRRSGRWRTNSSFDRLRTMTVGENGKFGGSTSGWPQVRGRDIGQANNKLTVNSVRLPFHSNPCLGHRETFIAFNKHESWLFKVMPHPVPPLPLIGKHSFYRVPSLPISCQKRVDTSSPSTSTKADFIRYRI